MAETSRPRAQPAGIVVRLAASLYDAAILFGVAFVAFIPIAITEHYAGTVPDWLKSMLLAAVCYAYFVGFWVKTGATTGMRPWRLRMAMAASGDNVGLAAATARFFALAITWMALGMTVFFVLTGQTKEPLFFIASGIPLVSMVCLGTTPKRQTLHDLIAGTSVFRMEKIPKN